MPLFRVKSNTININHGNIFKILAQIHPLLYGHCTLHTFSMSNGISTSDWGAKQPCVQVQKNQNPKIHEATHRLCRTCMVLKDVGDQKSHLSSQADQLSPLEVSEKKKRNKSLNVQRLLTQLVRSAQNC